MAASTHPPVGIDLGTTFSCVATLDATGRPQTLANAEGDLTTPSVVYFDRKSVIVGKEAVQAGEYEPERLAQFAKRDMGEQAYSKSIHGVTLPPEVLQALVLRKLKADAELKLGPFTKAVITVPAFFNEPCRKATQDAGRLAGIEVLDIINEPTAAAITYGIQKGFLSRTGESDEAERILVYDLGGGTFDVTLMEVLGRDYRAIATAGDVYLGGIDWDRRIADEIADQFESEYHVDPREDPSALQSLLQTAAEIKHALTAREEMNVFYKFGDNRLRTVITREKFEELTGDLLDRTLLTVRDVMRSTRTGWEDITRLLLVGGSTRMPAVATALAKESGLEVDRSLAPDEAVAHGAAVYAGLLLESGGDALNGITVSNVNSHDLGVLAVEASTGRPRRQTMIPRNSRLPSNAKKQFKTAEQGQRSVKVTVVEGGDDTGMGATKIGKCVVRGLPENLPAQTPIEVAFQYETNGRLQVRARLPGIDKEATLDLDRATGLPEEELDKWLARIDAGLSDEALDELHRLGVAAAATTTPAATSPPVDNAEETVVEAMAVDVPALPADSADDDRPNFAGLPGADDIPETPLINTRAPAAAPTPPAVVPAPPAAASAPVAPVPPTPPGMPPAPGIKKLAPASSGAPVKKLGTAQSGAAPKKLGGGTIKKLAPGAPAAGNPPPPSPANTPPAPPAPPSPSGDWRSRGKKITGGDS
ncbi:MAG: Hsp70 family protein [Planctomycetaceae bacterium]